MFGAIARQSKASCSSKPDKENLRLFVVCVQLANTPYRFRIMHDGKQITEDRMKETNKQKEGKRDGKNSEANKQERK